MLTVNEKYTKTITAPSDEELLWSIYTTIPEALEVVAGLVLWAEAGRVMTPPERASNRPAGLPQYCQDVLDLNEVDADAVLGFHRQYGPYWHADLEILSEKGDTGVGGYSLARFQAEVRALRAAVALARALQLRDRATLVRALNRSDYARGILMSQWHDRETGEGWRPWEHAVELPEGYPRNPANPGRLVARPIFARAEDGPAYVMDADCEFRLAQPPLSPAEWQRVAAAWVEPLPRPPGSVLDSETGDGLVQLAHDELGELLRVPFARPYVSARGGWKTAQVFIAWELLHVADFVRLGIAADISRGILPTRCASETCRRYFVPTRGRQVYCSSDCQRAQAVRRYRQREKEKRVRAEQKKRRYRRNPKV